MVNPATLDALVDFAVSFLVFLVFLLIDGGYPITGRYLLLPVLLAITIMDAYLASREPA